MGILKGRIKRFETRRRFDGRDFKFVDSYYSKSEAQNLAGKLREKGAKVRIVHTKVHGWEVWARK